MYRTNDTRIVIDYIGTGTNANLPAIRERAQRLTALNLDVMPQRDELFELEVPGDGTIYGWVHGATTHKIRLRPGGGPLEHIVNLVISNDPPPLPEIKVLASYPRAL